MPASRRTLGQTLAGIRRRAGRLLSHADPAAGGAPRSPKPLGQVRRRAAADGITLTQAYLDRVRELVEDKQLGAADKLVRAAGRDAELGDVAALGEAIVATRRGRPREAAQALEAVPEEVAVHRVPAELLGARLATDAAAGLATAQTLLDGPRNAQPDQAWLDLARQAFGHQHFDLSGRFLDRVGASAPRTVTAPAEWLADWVSRARARGDVAPPPEGSVSLALMDYKQPDRQQTSANVGDYIQTLASLGHLVRHSDLRFVGDRQLAQLADDLRQRVRPELRLSGVRGDVSLITVNRDATSLDDVPDGTWMFAFGWFLHDWFKVRWDFPFHPALRPLFVSFHINKERILTPEAVEALHAAAPIGCRDWTSVRRLAKHGVPAFFSGCFTTTVGTLFPEHPASSPDAPTAFVDLLPESEPATEGEVVRIKHSDIAVRLSPFVPNVHRAVDVLETYRTEVSQVVTSRLHCYLPVTALGVPVDFRPKRPHDIRFDGLAPLSPEAFAGMRDRLNERMAAILGVILTGADEVTVRKTWAELWADDVETARRAVRG